MKSVIVAFCILLLAACVSGPGDRAGHIRIDGMVIENQTQAWISAVRVRVPVTGNFVSCGNISPASMCSTTFPETNYTGNPIEITWSMAGQIHSTGQFVLQLPIDIAEDEPAMVRAVVTGPDSAGAVIVQD